MIFFSIYTEEKKKLTKEVQLLSSVALRQRDPVGSQGASIHDV
jgi:hypothetical protein